MFDLCFRKSKCIINYYVQYELSSPDLTEYKVHRVYPPDASEIYVARILEFGFSCCQQKRVGEDFVIVFTDETGTLEYVVCHWPNESYILCISSTLPWCGCFHALLDIIWRNDLHCDTRWPILQPMLSRLLQTAPPPLSVGYMVCPDPFDSNRNLRFRIPTPRLPHNLKYVMEYYNSLDTSLWIHVFVCLLLERSVLFFSSRVGRLTACILAAVSLLYPLRWVHSFYPLIPRKVIEVLECPVPFVAGIHSCNLSAALDHLSSGTCLVDLDKGRLSVFRTAGQSHHGELNEFATPKAVYHFLSNQLKEVQNELCSAMQSKNSKYANWKLVDGETCSFLEQLTRPFFRLIVNLLGCYNECIVERLGVLEVDVDALIACQSCPGLEPFLRNVCESQTVRLFLDVRARQSPDPNVDLFEAMSAALRTNAKPVVRNVNKHFLDSHNTSAVPVPISVAMNGRPNSTPSSHNAGAADRLASKSPFVNFGSVQWLRSKKIKRPGEPYSWDNQSASSRNLSSSKSSFSTQNWTQKLRAQANTLRNISRSKECASPDNRSPAGLSVDSLYTGRFGRHRAETVAVHTMSRPTLPNLKPTYMPKVYSQSIVVGRTRKQRTTPIDSHAYEAATSAGLDSSLSTNKWTNEPHQQAAPTETVTYNRVKSAPETAPPIRRKPPPRPPPPRINAISHSHLSNSTGCQTQPTSRPQSIFISNSTMTPQISVNGDVNPETKENGIVKPKSMTSVRDSSSVIPPRPKPWFPLTRITCIANSYTSREPSTGPIDGSYATVTRFPSHVSNCDTVNTPGTGVRFRSARYFHTTSKVEGIRQARKLLNEYATSTPPALPPRPYRRPLSQLFPSSHVDASALNPPSQGIARRRCASRASATLQLEPCVNSVSNPVDTRLPTTETIQPRKSNRYSSLPPLVPPRPSKSLSHLFRRSQSRLIDIASLEEIGSSSNRFSHIRQASPNGRRSNSMHNLATGDSTCVTHKVMGVSSENGSPIMPMGPQVQLRKKYATFSQRNTSLDAVPVYKLHRARTISVQNWRYAPPLRAILQQADQLTAKGSAPIAMAESQSGSEFNRLIGRSQEQLVESR